MPGNNLFDGGSELSANAAPVGDAVVLELDGGRVGAGVVGSHYLNGAAIAGAVLFDDHDAVVRLLAGANARQANHNHGDTVPFSFNSVAVIRGWAVPERIGQTEGQTQTWLVEDSTSKYRRKRGIEANGRRQRA
jgi:hypothetical protein